MGKYTSDQILMAFKSLCYKRGYTVKVVGDHRFEETIRRGKTGHSCKLWGTLDRGEYLNIYDDNVGKREQIPTAEYL